MAFQYSSKAAHSNSARLWQFQPSQRLTRAPLVSKRIASLGRTRHNHRSATVPPTDEEYASAARFRPGLPRILQSSIWANILPKSVRNSLSRKAEGGKVTVGETPTKKSPSWFRKFWSNPASPLIILPLLVGSQAIQLITLRSEMDSYSRLTNARLETLKEVLRRIQSGEWVVTGPDGTVEPVEGASVGEGHLNPKDAENEIRRILGTGKEEDELEWLGIISEAKAANFPVKKEVKLDSPTEQTASTHSNSSNSSPKCHARPDSSTNVTFY